jgi:peptidyl-prolyl cis-trans isomerase D
MLQSIRDRLTGPIVWFVIGLICIPFAFWGIESFESGGADPVVVKVGDDKITQSRYEQGYQQRYRQLQSLMGDQFRADRLDMKRFRKTALDDMIQESLMQQYARESGYRASDAALVNYLASIPAFQDQGRFSQDRYHQLLSAQGLRPDSFESQVRDSLVVDQMRGIVLDSAIVAPVQAYQSYRLAKQTREVKVARLPIAPYLAKVAVTDEQVAQRYEQKKAALLTQERLKLAYVELDQQTLPPASDPGDDVLKVMYEAEKNARYTSAEERHARHILINFGADKDASRKKAEEVVGKLRAGGDFTALAKEYSDDTGSKDQGGDLGWVQRGAFGDSFKAFDDALFSLAKGAVSDPVETQFGWDVILAEDVKAGQVRPFTDPAVREELLTLYRSQDAQKHFQDVSEKLEQLAFENPSSLDAVVQGLSLPLQTTDWFTRAGGGGILGNEAVLKAAFSTEVLDDGENSQPIALDGTHVVVIRKAEYEASRQKTLEEVAEALRQELRQEAALAMARTDATKLQEEVLAGRPFAEAVSAAGALVAYEGELARQSAGVDPAVVAAAFTVTRPAQDKPTASVASLPGGDLGVVLVTAVKDPQMPAPGDKDFEAALGSYRDSLAGAEFAAYRKTMEASIPVKIIKDPSESSPDAGLLE